MRFSILGLVLLLWFWPSWIVAFLCRYGGGSWKGSVLFGLLWPIALTIEGVKVWRRRR